MANGNTHTYLGAISGPALCLGLANLEGRSATMAELFGASLGGVAGAKIPDWLEPAIHPNHRSFFHSFIFASTAGPLGLSLALKKRTELLYRADAYALEATRTNNAKERTAWEMRAFGYRTLAGMLVGLVAGYASHLIADAFTPKSLPLLQ